MYAGIVTQFISSMEVELYFWFQQNIVICHTSNNTMHLSNAFFDQHVISPELWPPRLPDFSPFDFSLWGYLKTMVMLIVNTQLHKLKTNTAAVISNCHARQNLPKSGKTNTLLYLRKRTSFPTFILIPKIVW